MDANAMPMFMKPRFQSFPRHRMSGLLLAMLLSPAAMRAGPAEPAAPAKASALPAPAPIPPGAIVAEIPPSIFLVSSATQAVKDPFFPNSTRLASMTTANTNVVVAAVLDLALKAIFGTTDRPLATINNATFGVGEEQEVVTPSGRVLVRCVEIRLKDEAVVIESGRGRRELRFPKR